MKKKIIMALLLVSMFMFGACSSSAVKANQVPIKLSGATNFGIFSNGTTINQPIYGQTQEFIDNATKVHYIVFTQIINGNTTLTVTPRYQANGQLYCG